MIFDFKICVFVVVLIRLRLLIFNLFCRWGGCIVTLCDSLELCQTYIQSLKDKYYVKQPGYNVADIDNIVFVTAPYTGAEIYI